MKDREIIEKYMKSLKEELCMYSENLSEKTLPYIDTLKCRYNNGKRIYVNLTEHGSRKKT